MQQSNFIKKTFQNLQKDIITLYKINRKLNNH